MSDFDSSQTKQVRFSWVSSTETISARRGVCARACLLLTDMRSQSVSRRLRDMLVVVNVLEKLNCTSVLEKARHDTNTHDDGQPGWLVLRDPVYRCGNHNKENL